MLIVGCEYQPSIQQIAWVETDSGEVGERALLHSTGEAERFYRELKEQGVGVRVGIEATGHARWLERLLAELGFEFVDWECGRDQGQACTQAEERPGRRKASAHVVDRESISSSVAAGREQSRSASAAVAPPPVGADAHAGKESASGCGSQRRCAA